MPTPIVGSSVIPAAAVKALLAKRNSKAPLDVIDTYYSLEPQWGIRADVLSCQMLLETGYIGSWWSQPPRRNPAGIGVTGVVTADSHEGDPAWAKTDEGKWAMGYSFPNWTASAQAHYAHMSGYVYPDVRNNADKLSPRFFVFQQRFGRPTYGKAVNITDLNGIWAVPGTDYGQKIESIMAAAAALAPVAAAPVQDSTEDIAERILMQAYNSHSNPVWAFGNQLAFKNENGVWKLYSERAIFTYAPDNAPPWNVLIEDLGRQKFSQLYPNG